MTKRNGDDLRKWFISKMADEYWAIMPPIDDPRFGRGCQSFRSGTEALSAFATSTGEAK